MVGWGCWIPHMGAFGSNITYSAVFKSKPKVVRSLPSASMLRSGSVILITPSNPNSPYESPDFTSLLLPLLAPLPGVVEDVLPSCSRTSDDPTDFLDCVGVDSPALLPRDYKYHVNKYAI